MNIIKKMFNKITNGIVLIIIGIMHTNFALSPDAFGKQFREFSKTYFFKISKGAEVLPAMMSATDFETFAAFWFFYFGILIFPMALLVHSVEKDKKILPHSFTISYLIVVLIGAYMIPHSGMTFFMLPHALFMLVRNYFKARISGGTTKNS
ncbi:MAG: hypothetical protein GY754_07720 [bacterium]|nr:hypothetical protein [bacterium]